MNKNYSELDKFIHQDRIDYYKRNPYKFCEEMLGIKLKWYQELYIKLYMKLILRR